MLSSALTLLALSPTVFSLPTLVNKRADVSYPSGAFQKNGIFFGILPDEGEEKVKETMGELDDALGGTLAAAGVYAQTTPGTAWDGSQILSRLDDIKASKAVLVASVMPTHGAGNSFDGYGSPDDVQPKAIAQVMKKITDEGVPTILRWGHEMNWYLSDGTYTGDAASFKAAWVNVAKAVKATAPSVKMFWSPNVANADQYAQFWPDDESTVDYVGIDYYPKEADLKDGQFVSVMKDFHDKYAVNGRKFMIGETGLGFAGSIDQRISWLKQIMASKDQLPNFEAISWFNYYKGYDFKVAYTAKEGDASQNEPLKSFLSA